MRAERFGSYSIAATLAGIPVFSRRKSTVRYFCWCPPPRCQAVTSPCEFRPPVRFCTSTSDFSGVCLVISLLSSMVRKRRDGVYGLNVFIAIVASYRFPSNSLARSLALLLLPAADLGPIQNDSRKTKYSRSTRSSFRLLSTAHTPFSNRCENPQRVPACGTCREKSPCARDRPSP